MNQEQDPAAMQITPPFGYGPVAPLLKSHRVRLMQQVPPALASSNAIPLTMAEIPRAGRDYPVVFASSDGGASFSVLGVLGLAEGENLFIGEDGKWDNAAYQPAYLRRHPFCMAVVHQDGQQQEERVVCVEEAALDASQGLMTERPDGSALSWWSERLHLLQEYEADMLRTRQMCDWVARLGLLESFSAQAVIDGGEVLNLGGMFRISEERLGRLNADTLRALIDKGVMGRLYAHMLSLDRLASLLDRRQLRAGSARQ